MMKNMANFKEDGIMNAIFRFAASIAAVSMVAFSCAKIEQPTVPAGSESEIEEPADGDFVVTFECSLPEEEPESKTEFHDNTIWWSIGDQARFFQYAKKSNEFKLVYADNGSLTTSKNVLSVGVSFAAPDEGTDAYYFSVFPSNSYKSYDDGNGKVVVFRLFVNLDTVSEHL